MKLGARDSGETTTVRTFLIADVRGYTRFTQEHGDAEAARLAKKFADLARDSVEARGGRVIELRGDEALAVFTSTAQTVRAALELQATCLEETAEGIGPFEVLGRETMQLFVRDHRTMIAAPVQCDVDRISQRSCHVKVPIAIRAA
jgi:class 3 adenylate cyclase